MTVTKSNNRKKWLLNPENLLSCREQRKNLAKSKKAKILICLTEVGWIMSISSHKSSFTMNKTFLL